jgi:hypothetical protein
MNHNDNDPQISKHFHANESREWKRITLYDVLADECGEACAAYQRGASAFGYNTNFTIRA